MIAFLPKLCLPSPDRADYDQGAFARNDMHKIRRARSLGHAILDRSFCSTIAFKMAATQRIDEASFHEIQRAFYASERVAPNLVVVIMSPPHVPSIGLEKRGGAGLCTRAFPDAWRHGLRHVARALELSGVSVRYVPNSKTPFYMSILRE
ncbi:hypothetical protein [Burkholderia multivorans]|uniref:hypothetical protein n=1 Tax=Burkholderia multivorans TaxID=87883 RepID=UPI000CFECD4B|nr:hypothetical protein [Burkholderia multivorans]PRE09226.1 hypothetical protein C6P78_29855 [Burkholderia multivorans]